MELKDLSLALRRHWVVALLTFCVIFALGGFAAITSERTYRATAEISALPVPTPEGEAGGGQSISQAANYQLPINVRVLGSRDFRAAVEATLPPEVADVPVTISATSESGVGIITVSVTSRQPEAAAAWATALAERLAADVNTDPRFPLALDVFEQAAVPRNAQSQASTYLIASFVVGVIAAVFMALVAARIVRALDAVEEVRRRLGAPVLGEIPRYRGLRSASRSMDQTLLDGPRDVLESFQALRTNVELALVQHRPDVIAMTSWSSGEGKSTVAAALALSMAQVGHAVTVIDADLRQPSMHVRLGEPFGEGLADVTTADPDHLVRSLPSGVDFLAAGVPARHPADVMAVALPHALAGLRREGSLVIIDGPPIQGVAETPYIASLAHHVILVLDPAGAKLPEIERAVMRMREAGVVVLGVVLNRTRRRRNNRSNPYYAYSLRKQEPPVQPPAQLIRRGARSAS